MPLPSQRNAKAGIQRRLQEETAERNAKRKEERGYMEQAKLLHGEKDYAGSITALLKAVNVDPQNTDDRHGSYRRDIYYCLACSYSCSGQIDAAFEALTTSVGLGLCNHSPDALNHARNDPDLANLHADQRFEPVITGATQPKMTCLQMLQKFFCD